MKQPIEYLKNNLIDLLGEIDEDEWKILVQEQSEDGFFINACLKSMDEYVSKEALIKYSEFLEQNGYLDSDWRDEGSAVDRFLEVVPENSTPSEATNLPEVVHSETPKAKRWTISKWGKQDVLMDNGVISSLTLEETCDKLNQLEETFTKSELREAVRKAITPLVNDLFGDQKDRDNYINDHLNSINL